MKKEQFTILEDNKCPSCDEKGVLPITIEHKMRMGKEIIGQFCPLCGWREV